METKMDGSLSSKELASIEDEEELNKMVSRFGHLLLLFLFINLALFPLVYTVNVGGSVKSFFLFVS